MRRSDYVSNARRVGLIVPAFNVPYLPMLEPIVAAVVAKDAFALISVARLEWVKFESRSLAAVKEQFNKWCNPKHVRLHLDTAEICCEAALGCVLGTEEGPMPPYEELFASKNNFTKLDEAQRLVRESDCDWLSFSMGNIHGAISAAKRNKEKTRAKLDLELIVVVKGQWDRHDI